MYIQIQRSYFHRAHVQEDGVTQIIDTKTKYPMFMFSLSKNYMDIGDKQEVVDYIIKDLKSTITQLEYLKTKEDKNQEK